MTVKWKNFGSARALPRVGHLAKLTNWARETLVKEVTLNLTEFHRFSAEMEVLAERMNVSTALHQSALYM